jgi:hypothetical protein
MRGQGKPGRRAAVVRGDRPSSPLQGSCKGKGVAGGRGEVRQTRCTTKVSGICIVWFGGPLAEFDPRCPGRRVPGWA